MAISVRRTELLSLHQDRGENGRSYAARLMGKASTCAYTIVCPGQNCNQVIDFTDIMVKDVFVSGLCDDDIKKDVLGWADLDNKSLNETIAFVEAKEMARDALTLKLLLLLLLKF